MKFTIKKKFNFIFSILLITVLFNTSCLTGKQEDNVSNDISKQNNDKIRSLSCSSFIKVEQNNHKLYTFRIKFIYYKNTDMDSKKISIILNNPAPHNLDVIEFDYTIYNITENELTSLKDIPYLRTDQNKQNKIESNASISIKIIPSESKTSSTVNFKFTNGVNVEVKTKRQLENNCWDYLHGINHLPQD